MFGTAAALWWWSNQYVPFHPVYYRQDELVVVEDPRPTSEFMNRLEGVLRCYHEPFRREGDGRVSVPRKRWADRDLMWNYTTKANAADFDIVSCGSFRQLAPE